MDKFRQRKIGRVVSTQMASTVVVSVNSFVSHPLYGKKIRRTRRFLAHDPESKAKLGDIVTIEESRPMSKLKHWKVVDIKRGEKPELKPTVSEETQAILGGEA